MTDILPKLDSSWSKPMNDVSELVRWLRDNWGTLPKHSQIADTLERLAAENELLQANGENAHRLYCAILRERDRLREELVEANQMLRSCYSVTERRCAETNWEAFDKSKPMTTIAIQIGNSDDKLTQKQWAGFVLEFRCLVEDMAQIHFWGASANYDPWQNLCCVANFYDNAIHTFKVRLTELRTKYQQDSAAVLIGETEFI